MYELSCPRCGATLTKTLRNGEIGFSCPEGHGDAMTLAAVRTLCGSRDFANLLWYKSSLGGDGSAPCPVCHRPMRCVTLDVAAGEVELDVCRHCQMVWFDPHELEALPPPTPKPKALTPAAHDALVHDIRSFHGGGSGISTGRSFDASNLHPLQFLVILLGLPVEEDAPPLQRLPLVTWGLILICVAAFILTFGDLENCVKMWGFVPAEAARRGGLTWLTSMFMHGGIWHLVGNMFFLWTFGDNVEDELGKARYLGFVLLAGLSASLLYQVSHHDSTIPCVGASGFISGIIAMYAVLYPKVNLVMRLRWFVFGIPASIAFVFWMLFQLVMALLSSHLGGGGVAYSAHLGGALFGLLCGAAVRIARARRAEEFGS